MTDENTTDETENVETPEETVEPIEEATEEADDEVADAETDEVSPNAQHDKPLFTGNLGGHVLLDSTTSPE